MKTDTGFKVRARMRVAPTPEPAVLERSGAACPAPSICTAAADPGRVPTLFLPERHVPHGAPRF